MTAHWRRMVLIKQRRRDPETWRAGGHGKTEKHPGRKPWMTRQGRQGGSPREDCRRVPRMPEESRGLPRMPEDCRGLPRTAEDARGRPRTAVTPEAGRAGEGLYTGSQKEPALPIPWLQTGGLHRRERIHCCRKPLRVCCFMTPAPKMKAGSFPGNALCRVIETR